MSQIGSNGVVMRTVLSLVLTLSSSAYAAPQICDGRIMRFLTYADGGVMIWPDWRKDWIYVCNLNTAWNGVLPSTCASWFAEIKTAGATFPRISTTVSYADAPACAAMPTYGRAPAP